jgi:hypothetical protein
MYLHIQYATLRYSLVLNGGTGDVKRNGGISFLWSSRRTSELHVHSRGT